MPANKAEDLSTFIDNLKKPIEADRREAARLRQAIRENDKAPILLADVLAAAWQEGEEREMKALERVSVRLRLGRRSLDARKFFPLHFENDDYHDFFFASGAWRALLERFKDAEPPPGELTAAEKLQRREKLKAELLEVEKRAEARRMALKVQGIEMEPDPEVSAEVFCESEDGKVNVAKLKAYAEERQKELAISRDMVESSQQLNLEINRAYQHIQRLRGAGVRDQEDEKRQEEKIRKLVAEQAELENKITTRSAHWHGEAAELYNRVKSFLKEKNIDIDL